MAAEAASSRATAEHREDVVEAGATGTATVRGEADVRTAVAAATTEHGAEDVGEVTGVESAATGTAGEACATCSEGADRVVFLARILVFEHVVGLGDVLELLLAFLRLVDVRVVLAGEFAVRLRDLFLVGVLGDTQGLIEILVQPIILSHAAVPPFEAKVWVVFVKKSVWEYPCMKNGREP